MTYFPKATKFLWAFSSPNATGQKDRAEAGAVEGVSAGTRSYKQAFLLWRTARCASSHYSDPQVPVSLSSPLCLECHHAWNVTSSVHFKMYSSNFCAADALWRWGFGGDVSVPGLESGAPMMGSLRQGHKARAAIPLLCLTPQCPPSCSIARRPLPGCAVAEGSTP